MYKLKSFIALALVVLISVGNLSLLVQVARAAGPAVAIDTQAQVWAGQGNSNMQIGITVAANSNRALVLFVGAGDQITGIVSSATGAGATWSHCVSGGSSNGNGTYHGDCWAGIAPATGSQTVTINFAGTTTQNMGAVIYSVYNVDQTTPTSGYAGVVGGNLSINTVTGDIALSAHFDTNNNRSISGCTTARDVTTFGGVGIDSAHCAGSGSATFTWSGFGSQSVALGVNVKQAGGTAPTDSTPPSAPTNFSASAISSSAINLSWTASTDDVAVTGYKIFRNGSQIGTSASASYSDTGLTSSTNYSYAVSAFDASGNNSAQSNSASATTQSSSPTDTTPPSTPTGLNASAVSSSAINLSWTASTDNISVSGYKIFRNGALLTTTNSQLTTYSDSGLTASTNYSYTVIAYDAAGNNSSQSGSASAITQAQSGGGSSVTAASCSQAAVQAAINSVVAGGTVNVPAGTCIWAGLSISGIQLVGAGKTTSGTVITGGTVSLTKHASQYTRVSGFRFTGSDTHVAADGSTANKPYIIDNNYFFTSGGTHILDIGANGGLLHHNDFIATSATNADVFGITTNEDWSQAPSYGTQDSTGERNLYFEDNTFTNILETAPDGDVGSRLVIRHNTYTDSSITFHGGAPNDSSPGGGNREFEIYNNTFNRVSNAVPVNKWVWARGSSGVIANNVMQRADSPDGSSYPNKSEIRLTLACPSAYPMQYQVGQSNQTPENPPSHPLLIFGNTGAGSTDGDFITVGSSDTAGGSCGTPQNYIQVGRDYKLSNAWGWVPYTYPHPLQALSGGSSNPPTDTTPPSTPTNLSATAISSSAINLSWTGSTDNVGVSGYRIYRGGTLVGTSVSSSYSDTGLSGATQYSYTVQGYDAAGNSSSQSGSASATTQTVQTGINSYYVDQTAGSDSNNGTNPSAPWKNAPGMTACTSVCAGTNIQPGSTIYFDRADTWQVSGAYGIHVKGGISYIGDEWGSGSGKATVRATAALSAAVIDFREDNPTQATVVKGFDVDAGGNLSNGISNNGVGFNMPFYTSPLTGAVKRVENLNVHNTWSRVSQGQFTYGIIVSNHGGTAATVSNVEILNSVVHDTSRDGINLYPGDENANCIISNITVRGNEVYNTGLDPDYGAGSGIIVKGRVQNAFIENNYVHDTPKANLIFINSNETNHFGFGPTNINIRYNILNANNVGQGAILFYDGSGGNDPRDISIYGNLVYATNYNSSKLGGLWLDSGLVGAATLHVYNNTFYNAPVAINNSSATFPTFEFKNNIIYQTSGTPITGAGKFTASSNNITTSPPFKNTANPPTGFTGVYPNLVPNNDGFSVTSGSAIDGGVALTSTYNKSINSVNRPFGSAWDIGAYEYMASGVPVPGDFNLDHVVNSLDYSLLNTNWFKSTNISTYDLVVDNLINSLDFAVLKSNWGKTW